MVREFADAISEILDSSMYEKFLQEHPGYHLAHGFTQLDQNFVQTKNWQVGFYSPKQDHLGVFNTDPLELLPFEDAFKDGGTIAELKDPLSFISTDEAMKIIKALLQEKHSHEISNSFLVILQVIEGVPVYNITAITMAFSMISTHINALTGDIIKENKSSVLDLKKS